MDLEISYRAKVDQERLRQHAIELEKKLSSNQLTLTEAVQAAEDLEVTINRLDQLQTMMDQNAESRIPISSSSADGRSAAAPPPKQDGGGGGGGGGINTFRSLTKAFQSSAKPSDAALIRADRLPAIRDLPLGARLLKDMKDELEPVLKDQLEGLDSPLQPPSLISSRIEHTLRQHMVRMRKQREAELGANEHLHHDAAAQLASQLHVDLADALLALLREIAKSHRATLPRGGVEARLEKMRIENALTTGEHFEHTLLRSGQQAGREIQLHFNQESLNVPVTYHVTFDDLIETAASYWHIAPKRYVVADQSGTHFLRRMSVLDGLNLAPAGTMLKLLPLFTESASEPAFGTPVAGIAQSGMSSKQLQLEVDQMIRARNKQQSRLFGKAQQLLANEDDLRDDEADIKTRIFGWADLRLTRFQMLIGILQTVGLGVLLYIVAYAKTDIEQQRELCSALEDSFNTPFEYVVAGSLTDLAHVNSIGMYQDFLINSFPFVLFPNCLLGPLALVLCSNETAQQYIEPAPITVRGKNLLLGGLRIMQIRGETEDRAVCPRIQWIDPDVSFPWSNGSSMMPATLSASTDEPFQFTTTDLDPSDQIALGQAVYDAVNRGGINNSLGNVSLCYYDDTFSKAPFGPLTPGADQAMVDAAANVTIPAVSCDPSCPGTGSGYGGILPAFEYQTAAQLGNPTPTLPNFAEAKDGGFALTFSSDLTFYQLRTALTSLVDNAWFDRQTLAVGIDMTFYNPQMDHLANTQIVMQLTRTGHATVQMNCVAGSLAPNNFTATFLEYFLVAWLSLRSLFVLSKFVWVCLSNTVGRWLGEGGEISISGGKAGGKHAVPVWFNFGPELVVHLFTAALGLGGWAIRLQERQEIDSIRGWFGSEAAWPPPYLPSVPSTLLLMRYSAQLFGAALLVCVLRLALYYSIVSKRLFLMRLTMGRACVKLVPALIFLIIAMITFALTGHLLYPTSYPFHSVLTSLGTTVYLLRRPTALPFQEMAQSATLWPILYVDYPPLVDLIYLTSFTCIVLWILTNLYRTLIISEYSSVLLRFHDKPPGDLRPDPWPSPNPCVYWRKYVNRRLDSLQERKIQKRTQEEWKRGLNAQKAKTAALVELQDRKFSGKSASIEDVKKEGAKAEAAEEGAATAENGKGAEKGQGAASPKVKGEAKGRWSFRSDKKAPTRQAPDEAAAPAAAGAKKKGLLGFGFGGKKSES